jgi:Holliday junction resolvase
MTTPEKKVKRNVVSVLTELNAYYFYPATGGYGRSGIPDVIACLDGHFIGIECKAGSNKITPLQKRELQAIEDSGGTAIIYTEPSMTKQNLRELITSGKGTGKD